MIDYYELIGQTPVPVADVLEWASRFEEMDRRVAQTRLFGICYVSTVFLGLDHGCGYGRPILFETMAFWSGEGGYEQERCSTWLEAQEQHARMCTEVARPGSVLLYVGRCLSDWWYQAKRDLSRRWREMRGVELTDYEKRLDAMESRIFDRNQEDW